MKHEPPKKNEPKASITEAATPAPKGDELAAAATPAPSPAELALAKLEDALEKQKATLEVKRAEELEALQRAHASELDNERQRFNDRIETVLRKNDELQKKLETPATLPPPASDETPTSPDKDGVFITRELLKSAGACTLTTFDARVGEAEGFYWSEAEVRRLYKLGPGFLRFYEAKGLVPMLEVKGLPSVDERRADINARRKSSRKHRRATMDRLELLRNRTKPTVSGS